MSRQDLKKLLHRFRVIGIAEGISFLILLLVAMPLKYLFHFPQAVKVFGWVHGALFVGYVWFAFEMYGNFKKSFGWFIRSFIAAFLPGGTFYTDRDLKKEEEVF
jgi:integral membrane protein